MSADDLLDRGGGGGSDSDEELLAPCRTRRVRPTTWREGLEHEADDVHEGIAAIKGEKIPLKLGGRFTRSCVVRGIRYNPGVATELHGAVPIFTRALNARSIMSNVIPDMNEEADFPYCFWHPDMPCEDTLRRLVSRYPTMRMRYLVGRACAAAGYVELYKELDLLPEVRIAEEARESTIGGDGSRAVYEMIKYEVMNDYACTVAASPEQARCPAFLNGDTAKRRPYNITKDDNLGFQEPALDERFLEKAKFARQYLYTPLPLDLPTVDKDLLVQMAAYYGDVDCYLRLKRPKATELETRCILRGMYHNPMFANGGLSASMSGL
ncbi:hypothetical protein VTO42DRAFT_8686 [Malbranchea cinnamomea]